MANSNVSFRRTTAAMWFCASLLFAACTSDGGSGGSTGEDTTSDTGDDLVTTIPVTSVTLTESTTASTTTDPSATDSDATDSDATDSDATLGPTSDPTGGSTTGPDTGSTSGSSDGSTSTGEPLVPVDWCILQFPASIAAAPLASTTAYARVYIVGITDQTQFNDIDAAVVAEFGFGDDGSDPALDGWTWVAGTPNAGWDGSMGKGGGDQTNNDEYQGDLVFPLAGTYDYAARFSADGGNSWSYCDLDDLLTGGYTPAQAGDAVIE